MSKKSDKEEISLTQLSSHLVRRHLDGDEGPVAARFLLRSREIRQIDPAELALAELAHDPQPRVRDLVLVREILAPGLLPRAKQRVVKKRGE